MALSNEEIRIINGSLEGKGEVEHGGYVQMFFSQYNPQEGRLMKWAHTGIEGALCLVYEYSTGMYYFMIYDRAQYRRMYEMEVYEGIDFKELYPTFHTFETSTGMIGFSYASEFNARSFHAYVIEKTTVQLYTNQYFNADGTLNLQKIPQSWKSLLADAGFTLEELTDPAMSGLILQCLEEVGIATQAPKRNMDQQELKAAGYNDQQIEEYRRYQQELEVYENKIKEKNRKLKKPPPPPPRRKKNGSDDGSSVFSGSTVTTSTSSQVPRPRTPQKSSQSTPVGRRPNDKPKPYSDTQSAPGAPLRNRPRGNTNADVSSRSPRQTMGSQIRRSLGKRLSRGRPKPPSGQMSDGGYSSSGGSREGGRRRGGGGGQRRRNPDGKPRRRPPPRRENNVEFGTLTRPKNRRNSQTTEAPIPMVPALPAAIRNQIHNAVGGGGGGGGGGRNGRGGGGGGNVPRSMVRRSLDRFTKQFSPGPPRGNPSLRYPTPNFSIQRVRQSVLPDLGGVNGSVQNDLKAKLRARLAERRLVIHDSDDDDYQN